MIRSILYATDLGLNAPYVLEHSLGLAGAFHAALHVVHVVEPMGLFAESVLKTYLDDAAIEDIRQKGLSQVMAGIERQVLEGFRDEMADVSQHLDAIRSVHVRQGDPAHSILHEARAVKADMLVVGSHSYGAQTEVPVGRTATRLIQLSTIPVYLVPMALHRA